MSVKDKIKNAFFYFNNIVALEDIFSYFYDFLCLCFVQNCEDCEVWFEIFVIFS